MSNRAELIESGKPFAFDAERDAEFERLAKRYAGKVKVVKVDVDAEAALAMEYRIMSVPTVMVFQNGQKTQTSIGVIGKDELSALVGLQ